MRWLRMTHRLYFLLPSTIWLALIWIAIRGEFLASRAAKCDRSDCWRNQSSGFKPTFSMTVNSTLDCIQWRITHRQPLLARCVWQNNRRSSQTNYARFKSNYTSRWMRIWLENASDYLCGRLGKKNRLTLVIKPAQAVINRIWLAFRKSEIQLPKIKRML